MNLNLISSIHVKEIGFQLTEHEVESLTRLSAEHQLDVNAFVEKILNESKVYKKQLAKVTLQPQGSENDKVWGSIVLSEAQVSFLSDMARKFETAPGICLSYLIKRCIKDNAYDMDYSSKCKSHEKIELDLLIETINRRFACELNVYDPEYLLTKILPFIWKEGYKYISDFLPELIRDPFMVYNLLDEISTNDNEFIYSAHFYKTFKENVLPELRKYPELHIWNIACSTGENVRLFALLLMEQDQYEKSHIIATDISASSIKRARSRKAVQQKFAQLKVLSKEWGIGSVLEKCCGKSWGKFVFKNEIDKRISFIMHHNKHFFFPKMNVIILGEDIKNYNEGSKKNLIRICIQRLVPGGFLFPGKIQFDSSWFQNELKAISKEKDMYVKCT